MKKKIDIVEKVCSVIKKIKFCLVDLLICKLKFIKYIKDKECVDKYILFGLPFHTNIGDHAISIAEEKFLKDNRIDFFSVPALCIKYMEKCLKKYISDSVTLVITGGGFFGNQWPVDYKTIRYVVKNFSDNKIIIFPQTIYFNPNLDDSCLEEAKMIYNKCKDLTICTREKYSYEYSKKFFPNANTLLVPDIVLYLDKQMVTERKGVLFCLRSDAEKNISVDVEKNLLEYINKNYSEVRHTDTISDKNVTIKNREKVFEKKLDEFRKSELVITDRLHGMIFAAITGTPCIALGNYNYKVKGVYEWIKNLEYIKFIEDYDNLENNILELSNRKQCKYVFEKEKYVKLLKIILRRAR